MLKWTLLLTSDLSKMAPTTGKKSKTDDLKQEDVLQALVLADSFNTRFAPITHQRPRVRLSPLLLLSVYDCSWKLPLCYAYVVVERVVLTCLSLTDEFTSWIAFS